MLNQFSRSELLMGKAGVKQLKQKKIAVFGIGGVGGYVCEALVRSGVEAFDLIDDDKVCLTNLNRQIIATRSTVGKYKTQVMKDRILVTGGTGYIGSHTVVESTSAFSYLKTLMISHGMNMITL